jgi:hypothetical protein
VRWKWEGYQGGTFITLADEPQLNPNPNRFPMDGESLWVLGHIIENTT